MNSPDIKEFILSHSSLFWSIPADKKENISEDLLVETILNYGTLDDVRSLVSLLGKEKIANVLRNATGRKRLNYFPEVYNYFSILFNRDA